MWSKIRKKRVREEVGEWEERRRGIRGVEKGGEDERE